MSRRIWILAAAVVLACAAGGAGLAADGHGPAARTVAAAGAARTSAASNPARPSASAAAPAVPVNAAPYTDPAGKYLGVALPAGTAGLAGFAASTGVHPDLWETYAGWGEAFPTSDATSAWSQGAMTLVAWQTDSTSLTSIADGGSDAYLERFAAAVHVFAHPVMIGIDHEMNGDWYPWGTQAVTPARFVAAWRHIHDIFVAAGDDNVLWVWAPNVVNPVPNVALQPYYPGNAYVDIVGITGYYTGEIGEDSYAGLFGRTETIVEQFSDRPFLASETGVEQGADKAAWVSNLIDGVKADPQMLGFVYFDFGAAQGKRADWTLQDDPAALTAYRTDAATITEAAISNGAR
jgi:hypothetical protein